MRLKIVISTPYTGTLTGRCLLPNLNPPWDYLRQNKLCALVWESYDAIVDACIAAWNWLIANPERITSIGTRDWACVNF